MRLLRAPAPQEGPHPWQGVRAFYYAWVSKLERYSAKVLTGTVYPLRPGARERWNGNFPLWCALWIAAGFPPRILAISLRLRSRDPNSLMSSFSISAGRLCCLVAIIFSSSGVVSLNHTRARSVVKPLILKRNKLLGIYSNIPKKSLLGIIYSIPKAEKKGVKNLGVKERLRRD